jgi:hypothetical protein
MLAFTGYGDYIVKKVIDFSRPQPGCRLLFPAKESLVSDIPAGDGKTADLFYSALIRQQMMPVFNPLIAP